MQRLIACIALAVAVAFPALAGDELKPRDLTPVTWLDAPAHAPVEIVRDGQPRAVVYLAEPRATEKLDPKKQGGFASELRRLIQELVEVIPTCPTGTTTSVARRCNTPTTSWSCPP